VPDQATSCKQMIQEKVLTKVVTLNLGLRMFQMCQQCSKMHDVTRARASILNFKKISEDDNSIPILTLGHGRGEAEGNINEHYRDERGREGEMEEATERIRKVATRICLWVVNLLLCHFFQASNVGQESL
jgi:hypothetical protein